MEEEKETVEKMEEEIRSELAKEAEQGAKIYVMSQVKYAEFMNYTDIDIPSELMYDSIENEIMDRGYIILREEFRPICRIVLCEK